MNEIYQPYYNLVQVGTLWQVNPGYLKIRGWIHNGDSVNFLEPGDLFTVIDRDLDKRIARVLWKGQEICLLLEHFVFAFSRVDNDA